MSNEPQSPFLLYQTSDGQTRLEVRLENETVWLSQNQMAELFQTTKQNVSLHIRNIFKEGELPEGSVVKEYLTTAADGKSYKTSFYNLDVIISVGYVPRAEAERRRGFDPAGASPEERSRKASLFFGDLLPSQVHASPLEHTQIG